MSFEVSDFQTIHQFNIFSKSNSQARSNRSKKYQKPEEYPEKHANSEVMFSKTEDVLHEEPHALNVRKQSILLQDARTV